MQWLWAGASKHRFEMFVAGTADALFRTGYLMTGDTRDTEDLVQETFLRIARRWNRVEAMEHPVAYARRILINLALDGAERRTRQRAELEPQATWAESADENATQALRAIEDLAEFRWALAELAPRERAVLVLRYWMDLPLADVAATLGCSVGTVKSTASRGAARLAQILAPGTSPATTARSMESRS